MVFKTFPIFRFDTEDVPPRANKHTALFFVFARIDDGRVGELLFIRPLRIEPGLAWRIVALESFITVYRSPLQSEPIIKL
jgi:hypothetical protein